jgi:hypothetical protein
MNYTKALNNPIFKIIAQASQELNVDSYVIGGFVRDFLLQRDFKKDIDIVAVGSGIDLALKVSELLPNKPKVQVFKNYGTAMLRYKEIDIEFVGARKESYNQDSRNPIVENGTLEDDQNRRDFTINALAFSLNEKNYGYSKRYLLEKSYLWSSSALTRNRELELKYGPHVENLKKLIPNEVVEGLDKLRENYLLSVSTSLAPVFH